MSAASALLEIPEVHRHPQAGGYADRSVVESPAVLACGSVAGVGVPLDELFH